MARCLMEMKLIHLQRAEFKESPCRPKSEEKKTKTKFMQQTGLFAQISLQILKVDQDLHAPPGCLTIRR